MRSPRIRRRCETAPHAPNSPPPPHPQLGGGLFFSGGVMADYLIRLPWPPSKSSTNGSQGDYLGKARAGKSYKETCAKECMAQRVRRMAVEGNVAVVVTYHPPTNGRVDWDNLAARCKRGFDAVAEAIGIDDGRWWPVTSEKGEKIEGGAVLVHVKEISG